jgi:hypothetical protein
MAQAAGIDQWLKASQHRQAFAKTLWQDLQQGYGDPQSPQYWRQRQQRMAYQFGIVEHLLGAAKNLAQAIVKQLANTRFDDILSLTWPQIKALLEAQDYLSPAAQELLLQIQSGDWAQLIRLQEQTDYSLTPAAELLATNLISTQSEHDLSNPDFWPLERWLRNMQDLSSRTRDSMQEW